ncbi:uncharacterized protein LOC116175586 [Photinus pyralis]|uniref:uncharacterized protein LOC116167014 n=1 Tax=Photinus pyralis TaxID=7054 RepID=UPI00126723A0|nr:uncharacterized protein LOC116167014 [Photinus pyralis]XP_031349635.1 uncharacterized protein LOC116175586 [Photinus pyralis]
MVKNKKTPTETEIQKRKEKKKQSMRRLREAIKNDPVKHEDAKRKERERYHARVNAGKIKKIDNLDSRTQRSVRKKWRIYSKRYYDSQKRKKDLVESLEANTPPDSPLSFRVNTPPPKSNPEETPTTSSSRTATGKKMRRRNTYKYKLKIKHLEEQLKKEKKRSEKYKKRTQRQSAPLATPEKNVKLIIGNQTVSNEVKKRLLVGEVITSQIKNNLANLENSRDKANFVANLSGKIVKKHKCMQYIRNLSYSRKIYKKSIPLPSKKKELLKRFRIYVTDFLEMDENSRMCPGKKDTVTFRKCKKQKRYLNDSLMNLHKKFLAAHSNLKISYASFCKLRPFWVLIPNARCRETCLCSTHANMSLLVRKLKQLNIINESSEKDVIRSLCCKSESEIPKEPCLERKCPDCKGTKINRMDSSFLITEPAEYCRWISKRVNVTIKGEDKICQKTLKETVKTTKGEMLLALEDCIDSFFLHVRNIQHQYQVIDKIKTELKNDEVLLHMDFSENYNCKYGEEVQSAHFGGSKPQISLHTVVIYYRNEQSQLKPLSCCTFCEDLRHDPSAICAHLEPLLEDIKELVPNIRHANFLSDGPSTQYRNKKMFHLMVGFVAKMLGIRTFRWHFSEKGHGKGAPDGVGGCLKRTADVLS